MFGPFFGLFCEIMTAYELANCHHSPPPAAVKYVVGLALARAGIRSFTHAANRIGVHKVVFSQVVTGVRRTAHVQAGIADLVGMPVRDIFGDLTHPSLRGIASDPVRAEAVRIAGMIRGAGLTPTMIAAAAAMPESTVRGLLSGRRRSVFGQFAILKAFRRLSGSRLTMIQFWGRLTAREVC